MESWEQARIEETLRLCDQTIERIAAASETDTSRLVRQVKNLREELLEELRRVREEQRGR